MDLEQMIRDIEEHAGSDPLDRLEEAARQHDQLTDAADRLLDHFVKAARDTGCSWAQIGGILGVTKQAAQQRHSGDQGVMGWLRSWAGKRGLFTRFTPRARNVAAGAQQTARELGHNYVGTEHILLAMFTDQESLAAKALAGWSITRDEVVAEIETRVGRGGVAPSGHIPYTPRAKKILELSLREAISLGHNYIGTEHILLGVVRVDDGIAGQILADRDVTIDQARQAVIALLSEYLRSKPPGD